MSRSYKKNNIVKDNGKHKQFFKRQANKKVRRSVCGCGGMFKRIYDQYSICDWRFFSSNIKDLRK